MISFLLVGSGYRSEYYARVVQTYPELFRAMYLCRSEEKAALMTRRTGLPAVTSPAVGEAFHPDFVVIAVDRSHLADVAEEWIARGYPVVMETPIGVSVAQLCIRYVLQLGMIALPKTANPVRMRENASVDFQISDEDMATLNATGGLADYGASSMFPVFGGKM